MVMKLYQIDASPPVRAVLMTIEKLKIRDDVELVDVNLIEGEHMKGEYLKLNPQHTVPTLQDDDFVVWDSHAIIGYLVAKYGNDDSLYPKDPKKRALVDQKLHFDSGILFPSGRGTIEPVFFGNETKLRPENLEKVEKAYDLFENMITSKWLAGDELTIADICCAATVSTMNVLIPLRADKYPKITEWFERCKKQDFYKVNEPGLMRWAQFLKSKLQ